MVSVGTFTLTMEKYSLYPCLYCWLEQIQKYIKWQLLEACHDERIYGMENNGNKQSLISFMPQPLNDTHSNWHTLIFIHFFKSSICNNDVY